MEKGWMEQKNELFILENQQQQQPTTRQPSTAMYDQNIIWSYIAVEGCLRARARSPQQQQPRVLSLSLSLGGGHVLFAHHI